MSWNLSVSTLASTVSTSQKVLIYLDSPCCTPPVGGMTFGIGIRVDCFESIMSSEPNWLAAERGIRIDVFVEARNVPADSYFKATFDLSENGVHRVWCRPSNKQKSYLWKRELSQHRSHGRWLGCCSLGEAGPARACRWGGGADRQGCRGWACTQHVLTVSTAAPAATVHCVWHTPLAVLVTRGGTSSCQNSVLVWLQGVI